MRKFIHFVNAVAYGLSYLLLLAMMASILAACYLKQAIPTLIAVLVSVISGCHLIIWWHLDTLIIEELEEGDKK